MRFLCAVDGLIVQYSRNRAVLTCYHEDMESLADIPNFDEVGELQRFVDQLFAAEKLVDALDAQVRAVRPANRAARDRLDAATRVLRASAPHESTQFRSRRPRLGTAFWHG